MIGCNEQKIDLRDAFFERFLDHARVNKDFVILTADMDSFILRELASEFPQKCLDIGISEQNMINVAAGIALTGRRAICFSIASFATFRCFEQIKVNVCSMNLPVAIIGIGPGFSFGQDGPTHHGQIDLAVMRLLPEINIYDISSNDLAGRVADFALFGGGPTYIRLDKGLFPTFESDSQAFNKGYRFLVPKQKANIIASGYMADIAVRVAALLRAEGFDIGVIDLFRIKPIDSHFINEVIKGSTMLFSLEENGVNGGIGSVIADIICEKNLGLMEFYKIAAPDEQILRYGSRKWFHEEFGLDEISVRDKVLNKLRIARQVQAS